MRRAACEKKAMMMMLTCPNCCMIFPAPYRKGMLLSDPTVIVIPAMLHCHEKWEMTFFQKDQTVHKFASLNQAVKVGGLGEPGKGQ